MLNNDARSYCETQKIQLKKNFFLFYSFG